MTDDVDWTKSDDARKHVAELLSQSGIPLEARVAQLCREFAAANNRDGGCKISTEPLIYGMDDDRPMREIDQLVSFFQEVESSDLLGVQFILYVPIEAKHRSSVELFGLEVGDQAVPRGSLPVAGELSSSDLVRRVAATNPAHMSRERIRRIAGIKFKNSAPNSMSDENLVYNASASLYDFVHEFADESEGVREHEATILDNLGLLGDFERYFSENRYPVEYVARNWAKSVPYEKVRSYAESVTGGRRIYRTVRAYCPVVCTDSAMHKVNLDEAGAIADIQQCENLVTSVRISGWQSRRATNFSFRGAEAVTSVMTLDGLQALLPELLEHFNTARREFTDIGPELADRAIFEHDFMTAVHARYVAPRVYRSDLDGGDF